MENRSHAIAAGLFALLLSCGVLFSIWWFSQDQQATREVVLVARGDIEGLSPQAKVRFRGLTAGVVSSVGFDPEDSRNILVRIQVDDELPLTQGTRASLGTMGVTGLVFVQLDDRGDNPAPLVGEGGAPPRIALEPGLLAQISDRALAVVQQFQIVGERVAAMFDAESAERFRQLISRLESTVDGMDRSFAEAPATLTAIKEMFSPQNAEKLASALNNLEQSTEEVAPTLVELRALLGRVDGMAVRLDEAAQATSISLVDGTLPRLNDLLRDLTSTSRRIGRLVEEVESTPQMLLTGRGRRAPGPGEQGFDGGEP